MSDNVISLRAKTNELASTIDYGPVSPASLDAAEEVVTTLADCFFGTPPDDEPTAVRYVAASIDAQIEADRAEAKSERLVQAAGLALPFRLGGYGTILVDPPWHYEDQAGRMKLPYDSMTDAEILGLPVDTLAPDQGHLYLWTTDAHLELALACMRRWGYEFKSTIVWVKTTNDGERVRFGGGHYVRHAHELCLFGTRGLTGLVRDVASVFHAPRTEHSRKPDTLHEIAERLSPGPRVELFARRKREGWIAWGNDEALGGTDP